MNASENESFLIILTSESHQYFFNAKIPMFRVIVIDFNPRPRHIDHNFEPFAIYISMWCAAFRRDGSTTSQSQPRQQNRTQISTEILNHMIARYRTGASNGQWLFFIIEVALCLSPNKIAIAFLFQIVFFVRFFFIMFIVLRR